VFCEKFTKKHIDKLFKKPAVASGGNISNSTLKNAKTKERAAPVQSALTPSNTNTSEAYKEDKKE